MGVFVSGQTVVNRTPPQQAFSFMITPKDQGETGFNASQSKVDPDEERTTTLRNLIGFTFLKLIYAKNMGNVCEICIITLEADKQHKLFDQFQRFNQTQLVETFVWQSEVPGNIFEVQARRSQHQTVAPNYPQQLKSIYEWKTPEWKM